MLHLISPLHQVLYKRMGTIQNYYDQLAEEKSKQIIENIGILEYQDMWSDFVIVVVQDWLLVSLVILIFMHYMKRVFL